VKGSGSGVSLSASYLETNASAGYNIFSASFSVGSLTLSAGTYYLELHNASNDVGTVYWDTNNGLSTADTNGISYPSNSFEVDGNVGTVPEPTSAALFGLGLAALAAVALLRSRLRFQRR
jgi:hypothetical protein